MITQYTVILQKFDYEQVESFLIYVTADSPLEAVDKAKEYFPDRDEDYCYGDKSSDLHQKYIPLAVLRGHAKLDYTEENHTYVSSEKITVLVIPALYTPEVEP